MKKKHHSTETIDALFDNGLHLETRTVYIENDAVEDHAEITLTSAQKLLKSLLILDSIDNRPITIIFNTPGGSVYAGLAMYDAIRSCKSHVIGKVYGQCQSMGPIVLQACDERLISKNAFMMLHEGTTGFDGDIKNLRPHTDHSHWLNEVCYKILSDKTKKSVMYWKRRLKADYFCDAETALSEGLVDAII